MDQERHDHQERDEHEGPDPGTGPSSAPATIAASGIATAAGDETPWIVAVTMTVSAAVAAGMSASSSAAAIVPGKAGSAYRETIHGTSVPFFGNTARRNRADGDWKPPTIFGVHL